ncbi:MAG: nitrogenase cofactor biosynthesis protein NifB [Spirochaetaceae bacterium]|jgi:nitrogenase cofactor biosynthesis protein NifB|nr:nitrogenase cofactor biosynthesis protein NifB [Spirochaetaceae bacterium]
MSAGARAENALKSLRHPCFGGCGAGYARIHLPVAPQCNIKCGYCVRKFSCANESRPGVCAQVLEPEAALSRYLDVKRELPKLSTVGIAGPGDALANSAQTFETLRLIRTADPDAVFCLSTNGLLLPDSVEELVALGVSHLTVTVNTLDAKTGRRIYQFVECGGRRFRGEEAAALLLHNQLEGIRRAASAGLVVKANIVMLKGLNDDEIPAVVAGVKAAGAAVSNIMQLIPVKGSLFENVPLVSKAELDAMRKRCEAILPQMYHCRQCRADAIGTLERDISRRWTAPAEEALSAPTTSSASEQPCRGSADHKLEASVTGSTPGAAPKRFAVATSNGTLVDEHFGHARAFSIYEYAEGVARLVERRDVAAFCGGAEDCGGRHDRIAGVVKTIEDCEAVIVLRIGEAPRYELSRRGIKVFVTYDYVENAVREAGGEAALNLPLDKRSGGTTDNVTCVQ